MQGSGTLELAACRRQLESSAGGDPPQIWGQSRLIAAIKEMKLCMNTVYWRFHGGRTEELAKGHLWLSDEFRSVESLINDTSFVGKIGAKSFL